MSILENDINFNTIERFIELLTGDPRSSVCWRFIHDSERDRALARAGTVDEVKDDIIDFQLGGYGVFVVVNAGGHRGEDIKQVRALFIDGDNIACPPIAWHVDPDFLVQRDATHWHAYWRVDDCPIDQFTPNQKKLIAHYGSDHVPHDLPRVMRVPGTFHQKGEPTLVQLIARRDTWDPVRTTQQISDGLQDLREERREAKQLGKPRSRKKLELYLRRIDPGVGYGEWRDIVASIRSTDLSDGGEDDLREMARAWSRGTYWPGKPPANYTGDDAVDRVFDTMPPKVGGRGLGTIVRAARSAGLTPSLEAFGSYEPPPEPEEPSPSVNKLVKERVMLKNEPKPTPIVPGLLMTHETIFWYGPPKAGKTFAVLDLALSVATGHAVFGRDELKPAITGPVIYLAGEGVPGLDDRITAWETKRNGGKLVENFYYVRGVPLASEGPEGLRPYIAEAFEKKPVLVVLDTMARAMLGLDENSSKDVTKFVDMMDGIRTGLRCGVVAIAHSGKDIAKGLRGSNAGMAGLDGALRHNLDEASGLMTITGDGFRNTADRGPFRLVLKDSVLQWANGVTGKRGRPQERGAREELIEVMEHYGFRGRDRMRTPPELAHAVATFHWGDLHSMTDQETKDKFYADEKTWTEKLRNSTKAGRDVFQGLWRRTTRGGSNVQVFYFLPDPTEELPVTAGDPVP